MFDKPQMPFFLEMPVRYGREISDLDLKSDERNLRYGELFWRLPVQETALVLVDCWEYFPLDSFVERAARICRTKIRPVLETCRELGVAVVHAPSPRWAVNYPDFHYCAPSADQVEIEPLDQSSVAAAWPPKPLTKEGEYTVPGVDTEAAYKAWWEKASPDNLKISSHVEPAGEDVVVSTGDDLHAFCRKKRIKHLVYAGFATNICLLHRDYGVRSMRGRGYNIILIRDATTAVESSETVNGLWATRASVFYFEIKIGVTVTSETFLKACREQM